MNSNSGLRVMILAFFLLGLALAVLGWWLPAGWRAPLAVAYLIGGPLALLGLAIARLRLSLQADRERREHWEPVARRTWAGQVRTLRIEDSSDRTGPDVLL
jgi:hypothetical protein